MKKMLLAVSLVLVIGLIFIKVMIMQSSNTQPSGIVNGKLSPCPTSPNCLCSEFSSDPAHYSQPITLTAEPIHIAQARMIDTIEALSGIVQQHQSVYISATFASPIFGFIDDVEIRFDPILQKIHFRSASRLGRSDFGTNQQRMGLIRDLYKQKQEKINSQKNF